MDWKTQQKSELKRRIKNLSRLNGDTAARSTVLAHFKTLTEDALVDFIKDFCMTYDPRVDPNVDGMTKEMPFKPWPIQEELARTVHQYRRSKRSLLLGKSRDVGGSWTMAYILLYFWLFEDGFSGGYGTIKENKVDQLYSMDSFLEKVRFSIDNLPPWLKPRGYVRAEHAPLMRIINPSNGSTITGEVGKTQGTGGRKSLYVCDEFSKLEHAKQVEASLSGTTDCVIFIGTAVPRSFMAKLWKDPSRSKMTIHWSNDPRKDEEWARKKRENITLEAWENEYEVNWDADPSSCIIQKGSIDDSFALWSLLRKTDLLSKLPKAIGKEDVVASLDVASGGSAESVYASRTGPIVTCMQPWKIRSVNEVARQALQKAIGDEAVAIVYDPIGVGAGVSSVFEEDTSFSGDVIPFLGGARPRPEYLPDNEQLTCEERFRNARAEGYWKLRLALESCTKAMERLDGKHPTISWISENAILLSQCAILRPDDLLKEQLASPKYKPSAGRLIVESKEEMRSRGIASPDRADAIMMLYYCSDFENVSIGVC